MSEANSARHTPASTASHGRIVTENSALLALLREKSSGDSVAPCNVSADSHVALDVVPSNVADTNTNTSTINRKVEYIAVSKSRLSLNTNYEPPLVDRSHTTDAVNAKSTELHGNQSVTNSEFQNIKHKTEQSLIANQSDLHVEEHDSHSNSNPHIDIHKSVSEANTCAEVLAAPNCIEETDPNKQTSNFCTSTSDQTVVNQPGTHYSANKNSEPAYSRDKNFGVSEQINAHGGSHGYRSLKSTGYSLRTKPGTVHNSNSHSGGSHVVENLQSHPSDITAVEASEHAIHSTPSRHPGDDVVSHVYQQETSSHSGISEHQHSNIDGVAHQNTRLSLDSQHDRVGRKRDIETISITQTDQSVPPLDLSQLAASRQSVVSDSDSCLSSPDPALQEPLYGQNLHVSDQTTPFVYLPAHDTYSTGRTCRTYEVENPIDQSQLPYVQSSGNFRGEHENYRPDDQSPTLDQDVYRDREGGPRTLTPQQVDLADQLKVPYPFDTSVQNSPPPRYDKPPSPPVQTTPPAVIEPATRLKSRSNSSVYAVSNPNILRAQGISPPPDVQFTPRQYSNAQPKTSEVAEAEPGHSRQSEVRFSADTGHIPSRDHYGSPVRDRPPTPYAGSPDRDRRRSAAGSYPPPSPPRWEDSNHRPDRQQSNASQRRSDGLPPQHPPLDTKHTPKPASASKLKREDSGSIKRVYVESPSFTKEEEDHYRFVSSRLDDIEDNEQDTVRQMDTTVKQGYGGDDYARDGHSDKGRRGDNRRYDQDRYEDRNREMNGYTDDRRKDERYRFDKDNDPFERQERYERLQDERDEQMREPVREPDPEPRREFRKQDTEIDEFELQREQEYQQDLQRRMEKEKHKDDEIRIPAVPPQGEGYDENFARDSLEFPQDGNRQDYPRDSLDYDGYQQYGEGYNQQNREWGNAQQPYGDNKYFQNGFTKQSSKPDFYDAEDVQKMEIVHPTQPRYDFVTGNKEDYGKPPRKTYRDIVHKKREEEEKLDHVFITPKVPQKGKKKGPHKTTHSAQPEHLGYQPPMRDQFQFNSKPSSAEELWAKRSAVLSKKDSLGSGSSKGKNGPKTGNTGKWSHDVRINQRYKSEPPPNLPNQGQAYRPVGGYHGNQQNYNSNQSGYGSQGYTTPTRLQPLDNKPTVPPQAGEIVPTAVESASPYRRHRELQPITQEITTEDGQRISVDINLRLISPPPLPVQGGHGSPRQQQLALVPVQESQPVGQSVEESRTIGVPYQMQDQYGSYQDGYTGTGYPEDQDGYTAGNTEPITMETKYTDVSPQGASDETGDGYGKKYVPGQLNFGDDDDEQNSTDSKTLAAGYAAIYHKMKSKDPKEHPWYKTHTISDYQKLLREIRLNQGSLGPDLGTESYKEKMEKRHKQFEYARMVMEKNRIELGHKKPATFPRSPPKSDTSIKRKAQKKMALDYAKSVPKPVAKPRPNQYNSYEVAAQVAPGGGSTFRRSPPGKGLSPHSMDVIDVRSLEQRHLQERRNVDKIKHGMDSVLSQKV